MTAPLVSTLTPATAEPDSIFVNHITNEISQALIPLDQSLSAAFDKLKADPSNPQLLASIQSLMTAKMLGLNLQSSFIKAIKDTDMNTIRNFI